MLSANVRYALGPQGERQYRSRMDSARIAQAYAATLLTEAEALAPSTRVDVVCNRFLSDLRMLRSAVSRMGLPGGSFSFYRGLLLAILCIRSVATKSDPEALRASTWKHLVEDLDAFDATYGCGDGSGAATVPSALARMKSGDCVRHAMSCAINDHRSLRAAALELSPGLAIAHVFAPAGDPHIGFRDPGPFWIV
jgi:hypothetical protein